MVRLAGGLQVFGLLALLAVPVSVPAAGDGQDDLRRHGEYVFRIAGCAGCHTDVDGGGKFLAGGRALTTRFGTFFSPNITPDPDHGIGTWSESDFMNSLRHGVAPDGSDYYPVFPYPSYTQMSDSDIQALWAYLSTVEPVARPNRSHDLPWYLRLRIVAWFWKLLFFEPGEFTADPQQEPQWNRGAYLVNALAHCDECHTPRDWFGRTDPAMSLAGTRDGPEGGVVPNITPDRRSGIGKWSSDDLAYYLETGATPDGDYAGGLMAEVIDNGLRYLEKDDMAAMLSYLGQLPAIENQVRPRKNKKRKRDEFDY